MSLRALTAVWDHSASEGGTLLVLLALADYADEHGWSFPSVGTLAAKARLSERATQYAIRDLAARGEILIDEKSGPKGCNRYRLTLSNGGADSAPRKNCTGANDDTGGAIHDAGGCNLQHEGVQPTAPKPPENHQEPPEEPVAAAEETREDARSAAAADPEDGASILDLSASVPLTLSSAVSLVAFGNAEVTPAKYVAERDRVARLLELDGYSPDDVLDADDHWRRAYELRHDRGPTSARLTQVVQHCAEWRRATQSLGPSLGRGVERRPDSAGVYAAWVKS